MAKPNNDSEVFEILENDMCGLGSMPLGSYPLGMEFQGWDREISKQTDEAASTGVTS